MSKYLSYTGLQYLWNKIKTLINGKQDLIKTKTANEWGSSSTVPAAGEIIIVKDKNSIKIGDGTNTAGNLDYVGGLMTSADKEKLDSLSAYVHPAYTARTGKPTGNQTPSFGGTVTVSQVTSDATGHVTGMTDRTIKIPNTAATTTSAGLMSADDKKKLNGIEEGAQVNPGAATTSAAGLMSATDKTKLDSIDTDANKYVHPTYTARTGKPTSDLAPGFGGVATISQVTSDSSGHVTGMNDIDITFPNSAATQSSAGLMSAADKTKIDGIEIGANAYVHPTYTARTGKPVANQAPGFGETATVSQVTSDASGHVTGMTDRTITIPNTVATQTAAGLMSTADKKKLDGIAAGAQVNPGEATASAPGLMSAADKTKLDGISTNANNYTHPTYTARTGKPAANQTPGFGETATVSQVTSDTSGHVTGMTDRTIKIPDTAASQSIAGLMSAADKTKLDGIASGAQVNQNAYGSVIVGNTTIGATAVADSFTITAGSNVTLTPNGTNRSLVISATDTTYEAATTTAAGLMSAADKTKLDGIEMGAQAHIAPTAAEVKAALGTGSGTTNYLREDGSWVDPSTQTLIDYEIDLNTMRTVGRYTFRSNATVTNRPDAETQGMLGELFVFSNGQYFRAGNHFYIRNHRSGNTWGDWVDLATSNYYTFSVKTSLDFTNGYAVYENSKIKSTSRVFVMGHNSGTTGLIFSTYPANGKVTIKGVATYNVSAPTLNWSGTEYGIQILIDNS